METINERVKKIRKRQNLTLEKFAEPLGVKKNAISRIETSKSNVTEQMLLAICREYSINEHWLRTGEGNMRNQLSPDEELSKIVSSVLSGNDEFTKSVYLHLGKAPQEFWDYLKEFVENVYNDIHKSEQPIADEKPEETEEELVAKYSVEKERGEVG